MQTCQQQINYICNNKVHFINQMNINLFVELVLKL